MLSKRMSYFSLSAIVVLILILICSSPSIAQENQVYVITGAHQDLGGPDTWMRYSNQLKNHIALIERRPNVRFCMGNTFNVKHFLQVYPRYKKRLKSLMQQGKISSPAEWVDLEPGWYSGEFLVRSVAYAKYWLKSTLGYDSHWAHLNDTPSITPQFAQILSKSGVDLLVGNIQRLGWPPVSGRMYYYGALDGSKVLTYMVGYNDLLYLCSELNLNYLLTEYKLSKDFGPSKLKLEQAIGDLGTEAHLSLGLMKNCQEWNQKYAKQYNFSLHFKTIEDFASEMKARIARQGIKLPSITGIVAPWPWAGRARGGEASYQRAVAENLLPTVEKLSAICELLDIAAYPTDEINRAWEHILWPPDHNWGWGPKIKTHKRAYDLSQRLLKQKLAELGKAVGWKSNGLPIVVFNPMNWTRSEAVEVSLRLDEKLEWAVIEHSGVPVPFQQLSSQNNGDGTDTVRLLFKATDVPSIGYKTFYVVAKNKTQLLTTAGLLAGEHYIENEHYRISADYARGLTSIYDKREKRELIDSSSEYPFGLLGFAKYSLEKRLVQIKDIESHKGPLMAELKLLGSLFDYPVTIQLRLWANSPRIDIEMLMDYNGINLFRKNGSVNWAKKIKFHTFITPFKLPTYSMQLGVPYGSIPNLPLTEETSTKLSRHSPSTTYIVGDRWGQKGSHELGKWHKDIQKWFTMGNATYSVDVALINMETRTYMFNNDKRLPTINLMYYIDPQEKYNWQLALRGHRGDWRDADSPRFGWECSNPLLAVVPSTKGSLPPEASFITVDAQQGNVVLSAFKQAFDGNGYVLRFYETEDEDTQVKVSINPLLKIPKAEVSRTNLIEDPVEVLPATALAYSIPTLAYGIETLRFFNTAVTDITEPAAITDLKVTNPTSTGFDLTWEASGDDEKKGTAREYQIGYSPHPINEQNWDKTSQIKHPPKPQAAGAREFFRVSELTPQTGYYFAIRTVDEAGNRSPLSNMAQASTQKPDHIPPATISDLSAARSTATAITLLWTASGDDQLQGQASFYKLRHSREMIDATTWEEAVSVGGLSYPGPPTSKEKYTVGGLQPATSYYFAIKAMDEAANSSSISNVAIGQTGAFKQLVFQNGLADYAGCEDTHISKVNEEESEFIYGKSQTIRTWAGGVRSILIRFDLSRIPSRAKIHRATLELYNYDITYGDKGWTQCYRLTTDWDQKSANWWRRDKQHKWGAKGGGQFDRASDYGLGPNGMIARSRVKDGGGWVSFPVTPLIQAWLAGKYPNFGWQIIGNCEENCGMYYHSCEYQQDPSLRPLLKIEYDLTPEK